MLDRDPIDRLVLQEFHLRSADVDGTVARIVASSHHGREPAIPLLTSIDHPRAVATVRAFHEGEPTGPDVTERAALDPYVQEWQIPKHYRPRISERSQSPPSHYRLAVTESGINDTDSGSPSARPADTTREGTSSALGLLWIGSPVGTYAGLLVLLGNRDERAPPNGIDWPLPLSRQLGVRIYDSRRQDVHLPGDY